MRKLFVFWRGDEAILLCSRMGTRRVRTDGKRKSNKSCWYHVINGDWGLEVEGLIGYVAGDRNARVEFSKISRIILWEHESLGYNEIMARAEEYASRQLSATKRRYDNRKSNRNRKIAKQVSDAIYCY